MANPATPFFDDPDSTAHWLFEDSRDSDGPGSSFDDVIHQAIPPADPAQRLRIGRFQVVTKLGEGAYGIVLHVRDEALGLDRALKVPNARTLESPEALRRFVEDARTASKVDHPNVVRVYEVETIGDLAYIAMELCPERSLATFLHHSADDPPLPAMWVANLVAEIADGVQSLHDAGFLHRDLKPGNIMLVRVGDAADPLPTFRPKVGDFGLAKSMKEMAFREDTRTNALLGTLPYISPEQARGDRQLDARSDVYAIGAILYQLLTRQHPYSASSEVILLSKILDNAPPCRPRTLHPGLARDLETICMTALAKTPAGRYPSALAMARDLRSFASGEAIQGSPWPRRALAWARRHAGIVAVVAACVCVAAGGAETWRQSRAHVWIQELEAANFAALPDLVARGVPSYGWARSHLNALYLGPDPRKQLAAAIALADTPTPYGNFAYAQLLACPPEEIAPIVRSLAGRLPDLAALLRRDALTPLPPAIPPAQPDAPHRLRANASAALLILGFVDDGLALLRHTPQPDPRTFLIHTLGPAGVSPTLLLAKAEDPRVDPFIRLALLQSLGEVHASAWPPGAQERAIARVRDIYRDDPDSGVHGSAKWLLNTWGQETAIQTIDADLARIPGYRKGFRWRISPLGLTFVRISSPGIDREIEVSDSELTIDLLRKLGVPLPASLKNHPDPQCAATGMTYLLAAEACNALGKIEGLPPDVACYHPGATLPIEPVPNHRDLGGYRMPLDRESDVACLAGSETGRFFGDSHAWVESYARIAPGSGLRAHRVATRKPNDLGLFDTLGNAGEYCQSSAPNIDPGSQAVLRGGSALSTKATLSRFRKAQPVIVDFRLDQDMAYGVRVVRTLAP